MVFINSYWRKKRNCCSFRFRSHYSCNYSENYKTANIWKIFTLTTFVNDFNSYFIGSKAKPLVVDTDSDELKGLSDSQLIRVATRLNNSRTGEAGRGKGFNDILELGVNANKYPEIQKINTSILSRFGSYIIVSDGTNGVKETSYRDDFRDF